MAFRSDEEKYFADWLDELIRAGYIDHYEYEPFEYEVTEELVNKYSESTKLKTKTRVDQKRQVLLRGSVYTPDFLIYWNDKSYRIFYDLIGCGMKIDTPFIAHVDSPDEEGENEDVIFSIVEVKGDFDYKNMTRDFIDTQKFIWDKYEKFINLIKVPTIFGETFTPPSYLKTPTGKNKKISKFDPITLKQFLKK